jgi:hypothetical protein
MASSMRNRSIVGLLVALALGACGASRAEAAPTKGKPGRAMERKEVTASEGPVARSETHWDRPSVKISRGVTVSPDGIWKDHSFAWTTKDGITKTNTTSRQAESGQKLKTEHEHSPDGASRTRFTLYRNGEEAGHLLRIGNSITGDMVDLERRGEYVDSVPERRP